MFKVLKESGSYLPVDVKLNADGSMFLDQWLKRDDNPTFDSVLLSPTQVAELRELLNAATENTTERIIAQTYDPYDSSTWPQNEYGVRVNPFLCGDCEGSGRYDGWTEDGEYESGACPTCGGMGIVVNVVKGE